MKLLHGLMNQPSFAEGTLVTIGNFDGVHRGHQALLAKLRERAKYRCLPTVLMLFEPQPGEYFQGSQAALRISSLREKLQILKQMQVDYVYCLTFNQSLALMSAEVFAKHYFFSALHAKYLLLGEDFRFGRGRQGNVALLQEMGKQFDCEVDVFPTFSINDERVSSTQIRAALLQGELNHVSMLLGRDYSLCGRVTQGDGRGRQWGIPTANINRQRSELPLRGVFCVRVLRKTGEWLPGVANLGVRPTVDGKKNTFEIHLLDFNKNIYGEMLQVFFLHKLRNEVKFSSVDALIAQIHSDIDAARVYFTPAIRSTL